MALKKKPVTGMKDILPKEMEVRNYVTGLIRETYGSFGFTSIETPGDDLDLAAEDVFQAICRPLVDQVGHRGGRRNGINCRNFTESIAYVSRSIIAVHGFHFSCHK